MPPKKQTVHKTTNAQDYITKCHFDITYAKSTYDIALKIFQSLREFTTNSGGNRFDLHQSKNEVVRQFLEFLTDKDKMVIREVSFQKKGSALYNKVEGSQTRVILAYHGRGICKMTFHVEAQGGTSTPSKYCFCRNIGFLLPSNLSCVSFEDSGTYSEPLFIIITMIPQSDSVLGNIASKLIEKDMSNAKRRAELQKIVDNVMGAGDGASSIPVQENFDLVFINDNKDEPHDINYDGFFD